MAGKTKKSNAGRPKGAPNRKTQEREDFRAEMMPKVMQTFRDMLRGNKVSRERKEAAMELRKAVLPDLRPIDADTGSGAELIVVVGSQADADALLAARSTVLPKGGSDD